MTALLICYKSAGFTPPGLFGCLLANLPTSFFKAKMLPFQISPSVGKKPKETY